MYNLPLKKLVTIYLPNRLSWKNYFKKLVTNKNSFKYVSGLLTQ